MFILTHTNTVASHFVRELRDSNIQTDSMRFRRNMERIGEVLAYEISKTFPYATSDIRTPLAEMQVAEAESPVLATVLRAGLPLYQGFLNYFDKAESAFIGAYRSAHKADHSFDIAMEYLAAPSLEGKQLIIIDPMLATGKSLVLAYQSLLSAGTPKSVHIAAAISSRAGAEYVQNAIPHAQLWLGAVDETLNDHYYIVPGLGDAGDLAFGSKL
jgi:uracil phosphoribosyltransferase